ncbi:hypothetical protein HDV00_006892 [Rhizophlyctis rosea]|nr:hypothetical protein HDV00_006892 [Rhizophlyctis rosea]
MDPHTAPTPWQTLAIKNGIKLHHLLSLTVSKGTSLGDTLATKYPRLSRYFWQLAVITISFGISAYAYSYLVWCFILLRWNVNVFGFLPLARRQEGVIKAIFRSWREWDGTWKGLFRPKVGWRDALGRGLHSVIGIYMLAEALWVLFYFYKRYTLQHRPERIPYMNTARSHQTRHFRSRLFHQCLDAMQASAPTPSNSIAYVRETFARWFISDPSEPIPRENCREWGAWAFFNSTVESLTPIEMEELDDYVRQLEQRMEITFDEGYNPKAVCIRPSLDSLRVAHRPAVYYVCVWFVQWLATIALKDLGVEERWIDVPNEGIQRVFYRPATVPDDERVGMPIIFVHGIGIGLAHYLPLIARLPRTTPLYLLDWPHIFMRLTETIPTIPATLSLFRTLLQTDSHPHACFVGHSLGTAALSWALRDPETRPYVASTVFIDPICFLLCDPAVAYNFLYRTPSTIIGVVMNFFASTELYIAYTLARRFHWDWNVLFLEDVPKRGKNVVMLCLNDVIVPARAVVRYLRTKVGEMRKEGACVEEVDHKTETKDVNHVASAAENTATSPKSHAQDVEISTDVEEDVIVRSDDGGSEISDDDGQDLPHWFEIKTFEGAQHGGFVLREGMLGCVVDRICMAAGIKDEGTTAPVPAVPTTKSPTASGRPSIPSRRNSVHHQTHTRQNKHVHSHTNSTHTSPSNGSHATGTSSTHPVEILHFSSSDLRGMRVPKLRGNTERMRVGSHGHGPLGLRMRFDGQEVGGR